MTIRWPAHRRCQACLQASRCRNVRHVDPELLGGERRRQMAAGGCTGAARRIMARIAPGRDTAGTAVPCTPRPPVPGAGLTPAGDVPDRVAVRPRSARGQARRSGARTGPRRRRDAECSSASREPGRGQPSDDRTAPCRRPGRVPRRRTAGRHLHVLPPGWQRRRPASRPTGPPSSRVTRRPAPPRECRRSPAPAAAGRSPCRRRPTLRPLPPSGLPPGRQAEAHVRDRPRCARPEKASRDASARFRPTAIGREPSLEPRSRGAVRRAGRGPPRDRLPGHPGPTRSAPPGTRPLTARGSVDMHR